MNEQVNKPYKRFGALSSSEDPSKLSKTVEGILRTAGGLLALWGATEVAGDINSLVDQVSVLVTLAYSCYGAAETAFGLVRKIVIGLQQFWARRSDS